MFIKAIKEYNDRTLKNKYIPIDEEYEVNDKWGEYLIEKEYAVEIKSKSNRRDTSWKRENRYTENQEDGNMM